MSFLEVFWKTAAVCIGLATMLMVDSTSYKFFAGAGYEGFWVLLLSTITWVRLEDLGVFVMLTNTGAGWDVLVIVRGVEGLEMFIAYAVLVAGWDVLMIGGCVILLGVLVMLISTV